MLRFTVVAVAPEGTDAGRKAHRESGGRLVPIQLNVRLLENESETGATFSKYDAVPPAEIV